TRALRRRAQDPGGNTMISSTMPTPIPTAPATAAPAMGADSSNMMNVIDGTLEYVERVHILAALQRHRGNRELAAQALGIRVRNLYYRLRQYAREGHVVR